MKIFGNRKYKSGTKWGFWLWTDVPTGYITRLHIVKAPWFAICVHWLNEPDPEPYLHDHPVGFFSILLYGAYSERREDGNVCYCDKLHHMRRHFNFIRAKDKHTIDWVSGGGAITLCFMGPKVQEWGYFVNGYKVPWKEYNRTKYPKLDGEAA